jgi:hypothetical protein
VLLSAHRPGCSIGPKENLARSEKDIASFLPDGMNPAGDFAGGATADVIRNTALLSAADRAAIATYIASLPPKVTSAEK